MIVLRPPQLHRCLNVPEALRREQKAERRGGDDRRLDPAIMGPNRGRKTRWKLSRRDPGFCKDPAIVEVGVRAAVRAEAREVGYAADSDEDGKTTVRKAEGADPRGIDMRPASPVTQHVIDQALEVAGARCHVGGGRLIAKIITRMSKRSDDEPRASKPQRGVVVTAVPAPAPMRNDDERMATGHDRSNRRDLLRTLAELMVRWR